MTGAPLALTPGEPAGIGPDVTLLAAARSRREAFVALADPAMLTDRAKALGLAVSCLPWSPGEPASTDSGVLPVLHVPLPHAVRAGSPDPRNARSLLEALDLAVNGCLAGTFSGLVTGPLNKAVINEAGIPFSGHTEHLAARSGGEPVMMLLAGTLRVALATTHLPLREVPGAITREDLLRVIRILHQDLQTRFGIEQPRIAVLGLNPHAGESGHLGREEIDVISPVLDRLRAERLAVIGPLPADTAFTPAALHRCDAVLAMYHDQGLPALKYAGFGEAVNCTLGLPLVRTSVDHGTALDLAGTGNADPGSLLAALALAHALAHPAR